MGRRCEFDRSWPLVVRNPASRPDVAIVGAVPWGTPKDRVRNVTDVCIPFALDIVSEHAGQTAQLKAGPLRGLQRKFWKQEEVELLSDFASRGMAPATIAIHLARSEMSVRHAARHHGIAFWPAPSDGRPRKRKPLGYKRRKWSDDDIELLERFVASGKSPADIAKVLGRSEASVKLYAKKRGVEWLK